MNNKVRKLKIGLDYHGVITENTEYFRCFCTELLKRGHELHIITGGPETVVKKQLAECGIVYNNLFTIVDFYYSQGMGRYNASGEFEIDKKLWDTAKSQYCQQQKIDIHIDDSLAYGEYFSTPYCLYSSSNQSCILSINGTQLDLHSLPPANVIQKIENILLK